MSYGFAAQLPKPLYLDNLNYWFLQSTPGTHKVTVPTQSHTAWFTNPQNCKGRV